jgi:hypothetical protein
MEMPETRRRIVAAVVAFGVFGAAGAFAPIEARYGAGAVELHPALLRVR